MTNTSDVLAGSNGPGSATGADAAAGERSLPQAALAWHTFEAMYADGDSRVVERLCNRRQAQVQAASMLRTDPKAQGVVVFAGRAHEQGRPVWAKHRPPSTAPDEAERAAFEAAYQAMMAAEKGWDEAPSIAPLRDGEYYGDRAFLNGCWAGWKLARSAISKAEA